MTGSSSDGVPSDQDALAGASADGWDVHRRRALYRASHRGTKEMDILLGRYAAGRLAVMDASAFAQFEQLISLQDPDLQRWLMEPGQLPPTQFAGLIDEIRAFHGVGPASAPTVTADGR